MKKRLQPTWPILISFIFWNCANNEVTISIDPIERDPIEVPSSNTLGLLINEPTSYDGYTLFTIYKNTYLIDNCGRVINEWNSEYDRGGAFQLLEDGSLLRAGKMDNPDLPYGGIGGIVERFDWDGNLIWNFTYSSPTFSQHHGLLQLPNGNILVLAAHKRSKNEALLAGRNPDQMNEEFLYDESVLEIAPLGNNDGKIVWEWYVWDHLVQDFDETKDNYGVIFENPHLLNINYLGSSNGDKDWLHFNSLQYNKALDQIILSSQKLSEIYIIDHSTTTQEAKSGSKGNSGMGGDFLYRWGNPEAYEHGTAVNRRLFGQHNAHWIPYDYPEGGKILIFNNGLGRDNDYSSVDVVDPLMEGAFNYVYDADTSYGPVTAEWTYIDQNDPSLFYSKILSSAQRLPNGNTLICEGTQGTFFEINKDKEVVWKYINPVTSQGAILAQGDAHSSNVFQAIKYGSNYPGLIGKNLTPGNPIELNFDIGNCE